VVRDQLVSGADGLAIEGAVKDDQSLYGRHGVGAVVPLAARALGRVADGGSGAAFGAPAPNPGLIS